MVQIMNHFSSDLQTRYALLGTNIDSFSPRRKFCLFLLLLRASLLCWAGQLCMRLEEVAMPSHPPKGARTVGGARPRHHILRVTCGMPLPLCICIFAVMYGGFGAGGGGVQAFSSNALRMPCCGNRVLLTRGIPARTVGCAGLIGSGRRGQGCARLNMEAKKEEEQDIKFVEETNRAKGTGGTTDEGGEGRWVQRWTRCEIFTCCLISPEDTFLMRVLAVARFLCQQIGRAACSCVSVLARTRTHARTHARTYAC